MGCTIFMTTWVMLPPEGEKVAELLSAEPQCFFLRRGWDLLQEMDFTGLPKNLISCTSQDAEEFI